MVTVVVLERGVALTMISLVLLLAVVRKFRGKWARGSVMIIGVLFRWSLF